MTRNTFNKFTRAVNAVLKEGKIPTSAKIRFVESLAKQVKSSVLLKEYVYDENELDLGDEGITDLQYDIQHKIVDVATVAMNKYATDDINWNDFGSIGDITFMSTGEVIFFTGGYEENRDAFLKMLKAVKSKVSVMKGVVKVDVIENPDGEGTEDVPYQWFLVAHTSKNTKTKANW